MNNIKYNTLAILFVALSFVNCTSTKDRSFIEDQIGSDLDSLTFDELKESMIAAQQGLDFYAAFAGMGSDNEPMDFNADEEKESSPFTLPQALNRVDFTSGVSFAQSAKYPTASLEIDSKVKTEKGQRVTYYIDRIYYSDGTSDSINKSISSSRSTKFKVIDSVTVTVRERRTILAEKVTLSADQKKIDYRNGTITLDKLKKNYISYHLSDSISGYFICAQAQTVNGNTVGTNSYSTGSLPPAKKQAILDAGLKRIKKITDKIKNDKYKSKEDLLKDIDNNLATTIDAADSGNYYRDEYYYGNIKELDIYLTKERVVTDYVITYPVSSSIEEYNLFENENGLLGIITQDGIEIVKAQYEYLNKINDYYYSVANYNTEALLLLNKEEKKLDVLPYKPSRIEKLTNECVTYSNMGKRGALDKYGKVVIPYQYSSISSTKAQPYVILAEKDDFFDLYSADGKTLLFSDKGHLYAKDVQGWSKAPFEDGALALCMTNDGKPAYYLNSAGKKILSLSQYSSAAPFNEGFAVVSKDGKYGFIREDGSIALPLIYSSADYFSYGVTKVTMENTVSKKSYHSSSSVALINTKGEFILPFESYGSIAVSTNFGKRYYSINGKGYDHKGQLVEEED